MNNDDVSDCAFDNGTNKMQALFTSEPTTLGIPMMVPETLGDFIIGTLLMVLPTMTTLHIICNNQS
jgi:hypothetical protein